MGLPRHVSARLRALSSVGVHRDWSIMKPKFLVGGSKFLFAVLGSGRNITLTRYVTAETRTAHSTRPASPEELQMYEQLERCFHQIELVEETVHSTLLELNAALDFATELSQIPRPERERRLAELMRNPPDSPRPILDDFVDGDVPYSFDDHHTPKTDLQAYADRMRVWAAESNRMFLNGGPLFNSKEPPAADFGNYKAEA